MSVRQSLLDKIWAGQDPFANFPLGTPDLQGWNSAHPFLTRAMDEARPNIVLEVGVWKGGSVITMAKRLKALELDAVVIAVDTWLGAWDHWINPQFRDSLAFVNGYPTLYNQFASNVIHEEVQDYVIPICLDSNNAAKVISINNFTLDVIHIDAGHDYKAVQNDLSVWWPLLNAGGLLIGDDYDTTGVVWPEVRRAFDEYFSTVKVDSFESEFPKALVRKPIHSVE